MKTKPTTTLLLLTTALLLAACAETPPASEAKDLPSFLQSARVLAYKGVAPDTLDQYFRDAASPTEMPSGYAAGIHIIPDDSAAEVPTTLTVVTKSLWKGKTFDGTAAVMTDALLGPDLGVGAQLRIGSLADSLARYDWQDLDARATVDDRPSLITDYRGYRMWEEPSLLTRDTKGWVDECREVEAETPAIWLCRSTYRGLFWGYVVLQLDADGN